jgi:hypothetical protein
MKRLLKRFALGVSLSLLIVFSAALVIAPSAPGMAVYNASTTGEPAPMRVWFNCGVFCENEWTHILPGESRSRPGKAGKLELEKWDGPMEWTGEPPKSCVIKGAVLKVEDHGWAVLSYANPGYEWNVWGSSGQPISAYSPLKLVFEIHRNCPV